MIALETMQIELTPTKATASSLQKFGVFVGPGTLMGRSPIPFYDHVSEGDVLPYECSGDTLLRTAIISPESRTIKWLERHCEITQLFLGLGADPFVIVLGQPTVADEPDLQKIRAFEFEGGTGVILNRGTWHDFPIAVSNSFTCLIANSRKIIDALESKSSPGEIVDNDVHKISLKKRFSTEILIKI